MTNLAEVQKKIDLVKSEMFKKFPDCPHTITVLLWDDDTYRVECRYGDLDNIHSIDWYDGEVHYTKTESVDIGAMIKDEKGTEFYVPIDLVQHLSEYTKERLNIND